MIQFRSFCNLDPPHLARLWQMQEHLPGRVHRVTASLLEQFVLAKIYFDPDGLIVAQQGDQLLGYGHAGFGPTADRAELCLEHGIICQVLVTPESDTTLSLQLLEQCEAYLRQRGARELWGAARDSQTPFYRGLYGGSELSGVLESDVPQMTMYQAAGYQPAGRKLVMQRRLSDFRPPVNRDQLQVRRRYRLETTLDPATDSWWDACQFALHDRACFRLCSIDTRQCVAALWLWDMEPLSSDWGMHAVGLERWQCFPAGHEVKGLETFLLAESLKQLQSQGIVRAETHVDADDAVTLAMLAELGFEHVDTTVAFRKP